MNHGEHNALARTIRKQAELLGEAKVWIEFAERDRQRSEDEGRHTSLPKTALTDWLARYNEFNGVIRTDGNQ